MFEYALASQSTPESVALLNRAREAGRAEAQAAARRLVAVGELLVLRCRDSGEEAHWCTDTWAAVAAQVAAALGCSVARGHGYLRYAVAMRNRLPELGKLFLAGDIDFPAFQTIVFRTELITDPDLLARVDAALAVLVSRRPSLGRGGLSAAVDRVVAHVDADAVRRAAKTVAEDRFVDVRDNESGMAWVEGNVYATTGQAFDRRLDELAGTVCDKDPRSVRQRRADALGALAAGSERLVCKCGSAGCTGAASAPKSNVVVHVVAEQATVEGTGSAPGVLSGYEGLIPAELIAELASSARLVPIRPPTVAPEPGYTPSKALAEFVRCRDLTCRAPGCNRPAVDCEIDHTIPYAAGGATHPSNLKALCKQHHLLKTFWGWRDKQLQDGTVIWTLPGGDTYVTTPGSAWLFPSLSAPTGELAAAAPRPDCPNREAMMPTRTRTRAQNRANRIAAERRHNRRARQMAERATAAADDPQRPPPDAGDPPPF